jgi:hypothetical protein
MDVATDTLLHLNAEELREMVQSLRQTVYQPNGIAWYMSCGRIASSR